MLITSYLESPWLGWLRTFINTRPLTSIFNVISKNYHNICLIWLHFYQPHFLSIFTFNQVKHSCSLSISSFFFITFLPLCLSWTTCDPSNNKLRVFPTGCSLTSNCTSLIKKKLIWLLILDSHLPLVTHDIIRDNVQTTFVLIFNNVQPHLSVYKVAQNAEE